ncbi:6-phosphogluconate dehydrogenase [Mangrovimonas sp. YM274]|uniref:6-phosphogluconate dehydrogenase n=1 Tax=Mangrovimonas sp. YM274 TaxID=3070660 RepID=UPI0027DAF0C5|nr:6-phosphogluconate dehydrogenase [Mangrovimonas sp. YM274]WMI69772.1 6-phosphogluconate dehydrogenase [Mangrovimonas sp. YM274]
MKKILTIFIISLVLLLAAYFAFVYYVPYSEGTRSGELIKVSNKGVVFKTWEGEISQGISGAEIFKFSVLDKDHEVIQKLNNLQGHYVKVTYLERYTTLAFWGDTKYFVTDVSKDISPHFNKKSE